MHLDIAHIMSLGRKNAPRTCITNPCAVHPVSSLHLRCNTHIIFIPLVFPSSLYSDTI